MSNEQIVGRSQCPRCLDRAADNLINYSDGGLHCNACGFHKQGTASYVSPDLVPDSTVMTTLDLAPFFISRQISRDTLTRYSVKAFVNSETQESSVGFPLVNASNQIESYHYRKLDTALGELTREFYYTKGKKIRCPLFGWQLVRASCKRLVVCEGETDTLALAEKLAHLPDVTVVGAVGTGFAKKAAAWLLSKASHLKIVLAFDNDKAGREATRTIADFYSANEGGALEQLAFEAEDVGAAIIAGEKLDLSSTVAVSSANTKSAHEIKDDVLEYVELLHSNELLTLDFCPTLSEAVRFRPTNLIGILGDGGSGKSTLAEHILLEVMKHTKRGLMISAEMSAYEVALKLLSTIHSKPYINDRFLKSLSSKEKDDLGKLVVDACTRFSITDSLSGNRIDNIRKIILLQEAIGFHPELVVVDHLLAVAENREATTLEGTAEALKDIAKDFKTCVLVLCHTRKPPVTNGKTIWRPTVDFEYGSGGLNKWCDAIIGIARDKTNNLTLIETIKQGRMGGAYADITLAMNNWQLKELESAEQPMTTYETEDEGDY